MKDVGRMEAADTMSQEVRVPLSEYIALTTAKSHNSQWSFTQGLILGQLSITVLVILFIRFFIFGPAPPRTPPPARPRARAPRPAPIAPPISDILSKTYYNVHSHSPESLDWFNVLIAQTLSHLRLDARTDDALLTSLRTVLNTPGRKPSFVGDINVTEVSLGEEFPIFSNCRITPSEDEPGKLQARMDVDLNDVLTLGVETRLLLNWPAAETAVLPVALAVSVVRFSGTLQIAFIPSDAAPAAEDEAQGKGKKLQTVLAFSFLEDYRLEIAVRSLVGGRSRLQDVPKIAQLVESRLYQWIDERVVEPRFQQIVLPSLWPRRKTTREGKVGGDNVPETSTGLGGGLGDEGLRRRGMGAPGVPGGL